MKSSAMDNGIVVAMTRRHPSLTGYDRWKTREEPQNDIDTRKPCAHCGKLTWEGIRLPKGEYMDLCGDCWDANDKQ